MKIAVSSTGPDADSMISPGFGRCPYFVVFDGETKTHTSIANPGTAACGAGSLAAMRLIEADAEILLTGRVGARPRNQLTAHRIHVFEAPAGPVGAAIEAYLAGRCSEMPAEDLLSIGGNVAMSGACGQHGSHRASFGHGGGRGRDDGGFCRRRGR